jgi:hypothetical protein
MLSSIALALRRGLDGGAWRGAGRGEVSTDVGQQKETHLMSPGSHQRIPRDGTIGLVLIQNTSTSTMALQTHHQRVRHAVAMSADVPYIRSSGLAPRVAHSSDLRWTCFVASARNRRRRERGRTAGCRSGEPPSSSSSAAMSLRKTISGQGGWKTHMPFEWEGDRT